MPIEFVGDNRHRQQQQEPERQQDPAERRAAEQTAQLDELEAKISRGAISQESRGHLSAIATSATDWRVKQRANQLRQRAHVHPLTPAEREKYRRNAEASAGRW
jgi:hypothetical protein